MAHLILLYQVLLLILLEIVQGPPVLEINIVAEIVWTLVNLHLRVGDATAAALDVVVALDDHIWSTTADEDLCWDA